MNVSEKAQFKARMAPRVTSLRLTLKTGEGRGVEVQQANGREIMSLLSESRSRTQDVDINDAAAILSDLLGRLKIEWVRPPAGVDDVRQLATMQADASEVRAAIAGVRVQLDRDQLKHQHPQVPIGTRAVGGGNRFKNTCDAAWHGANTMVHMANWANGLGAMTPGQRQFHGQAVAVDGIHYEGFCLFAGGAKHVSFHCYPADNSPLKLA